MSKGLDQLTKQLNEASRSFQSLDREIATVRIEPGDEASVQAAIHEMETAIDRKGAPYRGNPLVDAMVTRMMAKYRGHLIERGEEAA